MQQRLEQFLSAQGLTKAQFADSINVARAAISHIIAGRNKPSYDFIVNTMNAYPSLNIEWLLSGRGNMFKDGSNVETSSSDLFSDDTQATPRFVNDISDDLFAQVQSSDPVPTTKTSETLLNKVSEPASALKTAEALPNKDSEPASALKTAEALPKEASEPASAIKTEEALPNRLDKGIKRIVVYYRDGTYRDFVEEN